MLNNKNLSTVTERRYSHYIFLDSGPLCLIVLADPTIWFEDTVALKGDLLTIIKT